MGPWSVDEVASVLLSVLTESGDPAIWDQVKKTDTGCLEFVIADQGLQQWQQYLHLHGLPPLTQAAPSMTPDILWQLQSGYELCHRWSTRISSIDIQTVGDHTQTIYGLSLITSVPSLKQMLDGLLHICDAWHETTSLHLVHQATDLVSAIDRCTGHISPTSPESSIVLPWIQVAQVVLKELLHNSWGYQLVEQF
ncbi:hypothetical protein [Leptothoe kymatousa]|uniref:Uncharacterized protein n=1 Tax=Leptothoe kymatousa TAU-MAC 1615 TaxID=2364775 RepID=A0ABS5Y0B1_9CYAN|nr:hypothetical protein [Leptothoe kymatousa]MBT9311246.1 hypothetical protein [Leptothoe kymatousa TAU-MAC 1615]